MSLFRRRRCAAELGASRGHNESSPPWLGTANMFTKIAGYTWAKMFQTIATSHLTGAIPLYPGATQLI